MSASQASATNGTGRTSNSIPLQQLGANFTDSQAASNPPPSSPTPPTASGTSPQAPSPSSILASTAPLSTASPLAPSCSPNQAPASPRPSTTGSQAQAQAQAHVLALASIPNQAPSAGIAGPQKIAPLSSFPTLWGKLRRNYKTIAGFVAFVLTLLGLFYAAVTFPYTKWSQRNDFRDGCINDLDHNLPMARECFEELARSRVSSVVWKRSNETVHTDLNRYSKPEIISFVATALAIIMAVAASVVGVAQLRSASRPPRDIADEDARGTASARSSGDIRHRNRPTLQKWAPQHLSSRKAGLRHPV